MYKKILIPTDGSSISTAAAQAGVVFAQQIFAEIIGVFVAPEYQYPIYVEMIPANYLTEEEHREAMRAVGASYLAEIQKAADLAGLKFSGTTVFSDTTAQEIVKIAEESNCDLIFMGSHGRSGLGQLLLGSVTAKVLSMSQIPVLVHCSRRKAVNP